MTNKTTNSSDLIVDTFTDIYDYVLAILGAGSHSQYTYERLIKILDRVATAESGIKLAFANALSIEKLKEALAFAGDRDVSPAILSVIDASLSAAYAVYRGVQAASDYSDAVIADPVQLANDLMDLCVSDVTTKEHIANKNNLMRVLSVSSFLSNAIPVHALRIVVATSNHDALREMAVSLIPTNEYEHEDDVDTINDHEAFGFRAERRDETTCSVLLQWGWVDAALGIEYYRSILEGIVANWHTCCLVGDIEHQVTLCDFTEGCGLHFIISGGNNADSVAATAIATLTYGKIML